MTQERRYLTPAEAAEELRVSTDTILRLIGSGELPALRVSPRLIRIPRPAFEYFRDGRTPQPRRVRTRSSTAEPSFGAGERIPRRELV
jgi:excisionase family DNA binding protein